MKKLLLIFTLFASPYLSGEIMECARFEDILSLSQKGDALLLEVDQVLLEAKEELATVAFYRYLKEEMLREGFEPEEVLNRVYPTWVKIQKKAQMNLASQKLPDYFSQLKNLEIPIFGFTHRGPKLAFHTLEILHNLGLVFQDENLLNLEQVKDQFITSLNGIFFLHPICDKGEYLLKLVQDRPFKRIVCVDYELVNLVNMQQIADLNKIPFLGLYYKNHNLNISEYTVEIGKMQLNFLDQILPDSLAEFLVER